MNRLLLVLERLLKFGVVITVFGYMSYRAHLNHLGISAMAYLGAEHYAMEAYILVVMGAWRILTSVMVLVAVLAAVGLVLLPLGLGAAWLSQRSSAVRPLQQQLECGWQWLATRIFFSAVPAGILFHLIVTATAFWLLTSFGVSDIAVGRLDAAVFGDRGAWRFDLAALGGIAAITIYSAGCRHYLPSEVEQANADPFGRQLWRAAVFPLALLLMSIPLFFGEAVHPTHYPIVRIEHRTAGSAVVCGLLVLETADRLLVWYPAAGRGLVKMIPTGDVASMSFGPLVDLLSAALEEATRHSAHGASHKGATLFSNRYMELCR